jgi:hypothetical protein
MRIPAYVITAYIALGSVLDIVFSGWPPLPHDIRWRLTFESFVTTASGSEMLAVLLFLAFAWAAADRIALAIGFAYSIIAASAYLSCATAFFLDSLQVKGQVRADQLARYDIGLGWTIGRMMFTTVVFVLLSIVAFRAFRALGRVAERNVAGPADSLIVGKTQSTQQRVSV